MQSPRAGFKMTGTITAKARRTFKKVCRVLYARGQNEKNQVQGPGFFGACGRTRTGDLLITSELLYQLSHTSIAFQAGIIIASFSSRVNSHFSGDGGKYSLYSQAFFLCISRARMVLLFFSRRLSSKSRGWKSPFTSVFRRKKASFFFPPIYIIPLQFIFYDLLSTLST